ncbi:DUF4097 family beta strand repeat-containing protein [Diplocloster modestus]|uniref:DUF4097 domain-containing protein n=1 Tax=Diplocloster modestus TaxID=2850322 RepID=A0ABS6KAH4_9FIRM|nr:DUF4097 family beta strand repeat-containing protein [Diplocloster modestus]MBU9727533.1 DUF4097 domain-containing protein [Diplocloster modestus]
MKKFSKIIVTVATCLVAAGAVFLGVGYALGGSPSFAIGPKGIINGTTSVNHTLEKTRIDAFENVKMTVNYGDITIVPSDGYYLEYSLTGDEKGPAYRVDNKTLTFQEIQEKAGPVYSFFYSGPIGNVYDPKGNDYLKLYVPKDVYLKNVEIIGSDGEFVWDGSVKTDWLSVDISYGDMKVSDVQGKQVELNSSDGKIEVNNCTAETLNIYNAYGNTSISQADVQNLTAEISDGKLTMEQIKADNTDIRNSYGAIKGNNLSGNIWTVYQSDGDCRFDEADIQDLKVESSYGDVELNMLGTEDDYDYDLHSEYGSVNLNGYHRDEDLRLRNKADRVIRVDSSDGRIVINTQED